MKVYAIGDVHGCLPELRKLLEVIDNIIAVGDKIVFIGDYIDRGPYSKEVVDLLIQRSKSHKCEHIFIKGNHEDMMLKEQYIWDMNGGIQTLKSYGVKSYHNFPEDHKQFYNDLVLYHKEGKYVFVHAGIDPDYDLDQQSAQTMIWSRNFVGYDGTYPGGYFVVHGHTPVREVVRTSNTLDIDTACVYGLKLTAAEIDLDTDMIRLIQIPSSFTFGDD